MGPEADDLGAIDVAALMERVRMEPQGTVTVQGVVAALRPWPIDNPTVVYGDLCGFDKSTMTFRCSPNEQLQEEEHVVLRGTVNLKKSRARSGYDLEIVGNRVGSRKPKQSSPMDRVPVERTQPKRTITENASKKLILIGTKVGIDDAQAAIRQRFAPPLDQLITSTELEPLTRAITQAAKEYDGFCLVRGGGDPDGFAAWEERSFVGMLASSGKCFYTALGHVADETLADRQADEMFATPTALGAAYAEAWNKRNDLKKLEDNLAYLKKENSSLKAANEAAKRAREERQLVLLQTAVDHLQKLPNVVGADVGRRLTLLQSSLDSVQKLPSSIGALTKASLHEAIQTLRLQTAKPGPTRQQRLNSWKWLLLTFFAGTLFGTLSCYLISNSRVSGTMSGPVPSQPQALPPEIKTSKNHGRR